MKERLTYCVGCGGTGLPHKKINNTSNILNKQMKSSNKKTNEIIHIRESCKLAKGTDKMQFAYTWDQELQMT
jgi:hypothetical protein